MDGFINSKIEKQTIYEIYRACRLCGAGAGYKMPINQNAVKLDGAEVELKQKIRECVQIEVHQDDKMPPLICELCVDKVNDFYEFLEMCRHTNKRTRLRLGLPPQTMPSGAPDAGDCILGVTEPVFLNDDSTLRSRSKSSKSSRNSKSDNKSMATSNNLSRRDDKTSESRSLRSKQPSPPRLRGSRRYHDEDEKLSNLQKSKGTAEAMPKSILKKQKDGKNDDDNSYLSPRLKRPRDRDSGKKEIQNKKVKIQERPLPHALRSSRPPPSARRKSPPPAHNCSTCKAKFDNYRSLNNHMRIHTFKQADRKQNKKDSKDVKCTDCRKSFSSKTLLNIHRCPKQGGDCNKCSKHFYSQKSLIQHKRTCGQRRRDVYIHPNTLRILKQLQIRVARCDPILKNVSGDHYDVSSVEQVFGLDENCLYPYKSVGSTRIKFEPGYMVDINDDIKEALDADKYVHWDSDDTDSDVELTDEHRKKIDSLVSLSLRTIFSKRFLGKVPKKRRKVKAEKAFDSILNVTDFDTDLKRGIDNIIDSLNEQIDESVNKGLANKSGDNDSLFGDDNAPTVTNDDFDSLFNTNKDISKTDTMEDNLCKDISKESEKNPSIEDSEEKDQIIKDNIIEGLNVKEESSEEQEVSCDNTDIAIAEEYTEKSVEESKESLELRSSVLLEGDIERNYLEIEKSKDIDNITEESSQIIDSDKVVNDSDSVLSARSELTKNENTESGTYDDDNIDEVKKASENTENESNEYKAPNTETEETREESREAENIKENKESHVNGETLLEKKSTMDDFEDLSDADIDDKRLMAALDAQIGESETADAKSEKESHNKDDNLIKSDDLESISDDDFNLND